MGLLELLFPKKEPVNSFDGYFQMLNAYNPVFTTYDGGIYEMELTRAAIHAFASAASKLKPEIQGKAYKNLEKTLQFKPNPFMDTTKFIYRLATILSVDTTAFIVPLYGADYKTIVGYYPLLPQSTELVRVKGGPWLRYRFPNGQRAAMELDRVGILTNFQYSNDLFGDTNQALRPTLELLDIQKQGIEDGIQQSAKLRFMAKIGQALRPEDITKERQRFSTENLSSDNTSGVLMFDAKYSEVKQIDSKPFIVDDKQMAIIQNNVFNYFGVNEKIIQNSFNEEEFTAFYEGKVEPFAIQLGLVMTNMTFTPKEVAFGNQIMFSSNRLAYASNNTKLVMSQQLFDRGILSRNEIREIWQMEPLGEEGDKRYIRLEYADVDNLTKIQGEELTNNDENMV